MTQELDEEIYIFPMPKHRAFTYHEKKMNRMDREQLLEWMFIPKLDREKARYFINEKYDKMVGDRFLKQVCIGYEMEHRKKLTDKHRAFIDDIFELKELFNNLTLIDTLAIYKNSILYQERNRETIKSSEKRQEEGLLYALKLHEENWNLSIKNLGKVKNKENIPHSM